MHQRSSLTSDRPPALGVITTRTKVSEYDLARCWRVIVISVTLAVLFCSMFLIPSFQPSEQTTRFVTLSLTSALAQTSFSTASLSFLPYLGTFAMLFTASLTYTIARMTWRRRYPYSLLCKCGGRAPASYVFSGGFVIAGTLLVPCILLVGNSIRSDASVSFAGSVISLLADLTGACAMLSMMLMSLISVYEFEVAHNRCAALFAVNGVLYQWLVFGLSVSLGKDSCINWLRLACVILQTLLSIGMFVCMEIERVFNSTGTGNTTSVEQLLEEPMSPSLSRSKTTSTTTGGASTSFVFLPPVQVHPSMKVWAVLQYANIAISGVFLCTLAEYLNQYSIALAH